MNISKKNNLKLPSLPLFTDTFIAETTHLSNEAVGMYIRILCWLWTKKGKPITLKEAQSICYCRNNECDKLVKDVLDEFFVSENSLNPNENSLEDSENSLRYSHKRIDKELDYLTDYYEQKSYAGRKSAEVRSSQFNEPSTPIPIPIPIPSINIFNSFWSNILIKRGSKKLAQIKFEKECKGANPISIAKLYNDFTSTIKDKAFVPHVSTWLTQRRFEDEDINKSSQPKIELKLKDGTCYKRTGNKSGEYEEIVINNEKWYKHIFKESEPLKKTI